MAAVKRSNGELGSAYRHGNLSGAGLTRGAWAGRGLTADQEAQRGNTGNAGGAWAGQVSLVQAASNSHFPTANTRQSTRRAWLDREHGTASRLQGLIVMDLLC